MNWKEILACFGLVCLSLQLLGIIALLAEILTIQRSQFDYQTEADLCFEDAYKTLSQCHVERDEDGSYHWYYNPNEGEM